MNEHDLEVLKTVFTLAFIGALIGLSKLLVSNEPLSVRLVVGRTILGSATSLIAGLVLLQIPDINLLVLIAIASGLGILGSTFIEEFLKKKANKWN